MQSSRLFFSYFVFVTLANMTSPLFLTLFIPKTNTFAQLCCVNCTSKHAWMHTCPNSWWPLQLPGSSHLWLKWILFACQQWEKFVPLFCLCMPRLCWNPHRTPLPLSPLPNHSLQRVLIFDNKPSSNLSCGPTSSALHVCGLGLE